MVEIRAIEQLDYEEWLPLWADHIAGFRKKLLDEITTVVFKRFLDDERQLFCRVAVEDSKIIGFVTYAIIDFTQTLEGQIYLNDLYVSPEGRRKGIGSQLVEYVYKAGDELGIPRVFWFCHYDNEPANRLYKKIAETKTCVYRRKLP